MYPNTPGSKTGGASADAAKRMTGRVAFLRSAVTDLMAKGYWLTADEIADQLKDNVLAIRPRVSELVAAGVLVKTNQRRKNTSGMGAHVLRFRTATEAVPLPKVETKAKPARIAVHNDQNLFFGGAQ